jgi:hypothetical protein
MEQDKELTSIKKIYKSGGKCKCECDVCFFSSNDNTYFCFFIHLDTDIKMDLCRLLLNKFSDKRRKEKLKEQIDEWNHRYTFKDAV